MGNKNIIIPDRIFHKLWNIALESKDFTSFYNNITNLESKQYTNLFKFGLDMELLYETLSSIYKASHYTIPDLLEEYDIKKSSLSHRFCIPIRTVENWCNGTGKCSSYIIIMILEGYGIKYLPERVYTKSLFDIRSKNTVKKRCLDNNSVKVNEENNKNEDLANITLDDIDDLLDNIGLESFSIRDFEQTHMIDNKDLLIETEYLRKHMK